MTHHQPGSPRGHENPNFHVFANRTKLSRFSLEKKTRLLRKNTEKSIEYYDKLEETGQKVSRKFVSERFFPKREAKCTSLLSDGLPRKTEKESRKSSKEN